MRRYDVDLPKTMVSLLSGSNGSHIGTIVRDPVFSWGKLREIIDTVMAAIAGISVLDLKLQ